MSKIFSHRAGARELAIGLAAISAAAMLQAASPETAVLVSVRDNTLYDDGVGGLSNGAGEHFFSGLTGSFSRRRGLLRFDVAAAVPAGARILEARLTLHNSRTQTGGSPFGLHRMVSDWGEGASNAGERSGIGVAASPGDATWLHRFYNTQFWSAPGGDFVAQPSATRGVDGVGSWEWPTSAAAVADVQFWLDAPATNFGWCVIGDETQPSAKRFDTRETATPANRPRLEVIYDPCPGDLNDDTTIDLADADTLIDQLGLPGSPAGGDIDRDALVTLTDFAILQARFGATCPT